MFRCFYMLKIKRCNQRSLADQGQAKTLPELEMGRVYTQIRIDDFRGQSGMLTSKVGAVECRVGKKLKT